jgi:hypothetical protein
MFAGGLIGESKSEILRHLSRVAPFFVVRRGGAAKIEEFPVVLKPDIGERGSGVFIARSQQEVDIYLKSAACDIIIQKYVPGCEFGVYYLRHPHESAGRVIYVTEKRFPHVTGDGRRSLRDLILQDSRAVCLASAYFRVAKCPLETIPGKGEHVQLVEIGSHCRGTVFLDGSRWITPALSSAIDQVSRSHPGFHLGRYDVRSESPEALQRGEFQVLELNGVSAEATHIYDPSIPVWRKYHVIASHWRTAFEIGAIHRARGFQPMTLGDLRRLLFASRSTAVSPLAHVA